MATIPLSGTQYTLRAGDDVAHVTSVGASLRRLQHDGRDLVVPFEPDQVRPAYRGALLAPWPNRVVDGVYTFAGVTYKLALTDPGRPNALHGLAVWLDFAVVSQPCLLLGVSVGVVCNVMFPEWLITALFAAFLSFATFKTYGTGMRRWRGETAAARMILEGPSTVEGT
jgi:aldose 1-epimerase